MQSLDLSTGLVTTYPGTGGFRPGGTLLRHLARLSDSVYLSVGDSLVRVQAQTGQVLAGLRVPGSGFNLATDPTLALRGRLPVPDEVSIPGCAITCLEGAVAVDRSQDKAYVVWAGSLTGGSYGFSFAWCLEHLHLELRAPSGTVSFDTPGVAPCPRSGVDSRR